MPLRRVKWSSQYLNPPSSPRREKPSTFGPVPRGAKSPSPDVCTRGPADRSEASRNASALVTKLLQILVLLLPAVAGRGRGRSRDLSSRIRPSNREERAPACATCMLVWLAATTATHGHPVRAAACVRSTINFTLQ